MNDYKPPTVTSIGKVEDLTQLWIIVKNRSGGDRLGHRRRRIHVPGS